jgi:hypothetical protein
MAGKVARLTPQQRRRSSYETFDGCAYRWDKLYQTCNCGDRDSQHLDDGRGACTMPGCHCQAYVPLEDRGDEANRGIAFHECAARYIERLAAKQLEADHEEATEAFREGIEASRPAPHLLPQISKLWQKFTGWFQLDLAAYYAAELKQHTCSGRGCGHSEKDHKDGRCTRCRCQQFQPGFTWTPDLIYVRPGEIEIKDWKTYYKGLTETQARDEFQLKFYLVEAMRIWPNFARYKFTFDFVRLGFEVSVTLTPEEIEAFQAEVEAIQAGMAQARAVGIYPATPGAQCGLCRLRCPVVDAGDRLPVRVQTADQAAEMFGRLMVLEQERKALKKALGGWAATEGAVVCRGQEYVHQSQTSYSVTMADVDPFVGQHQHELVRFGLSALKPIWKKRTDMPADLQLAARKSTSWVFRSRKVGSHAPEGHDDVLAEDGQEE